jgi:hypothetical protein
VSQSDHAAALEGLNLEDLRAAWRARYGAPPALRSIELVRLMLAWRMQAEESGGLDAETRRALRAAPPASARAGALSPGARLAREWQGAVHEAIVLADSGFLYRGERYKSLSEIARAITGVRWNGPRFFGLRAETKAP